jgi:hypothetical protein
MMIVNISFHIYFIKDLQKFYLSYIQNIIDDCSEKISNQQYLELCNINKYLFESLF